MWMAELASRSGLTVPTIKYYLREGLLPPGETVGATRTRYDESHVRRLRLVRALDEPGVLAAAPARHLRTARSSWWVRGYYRVWERLPGVRDGLYGRGVIALSPEAQRRIDLLPPVLSDDLAISEAFTPGERRVVPEAVVTIRVPRTAADLIRRRVRVATGNREADGCNRASKERAECGDSKCCPCPSFSGHLISIYRCDDRRCLTGKIDQDRSCRSTILCAVKDAGEHDKRTKWWQKKSDREQNSDGSGRTDGRQNTYQGSEQGADETEQEVRRRKGFRKAEHKDIKKCHGYSFHPRSERQDRHLDTETVDEDKSTKDCQ